VSVKIDGIRYSWTQPMCENDWYAMNPNRTPVRMLAGARQVRCCVCGMMTIDGIFVRIHPSLVPYPALEDDE
jgi:LSD1 subclass zinc finger protein